MQAALYPFLMYLVEHFVKMRNAEMRPKWSKVAIKYSEWIKRDLNRPVGSMPATHCRQMPRKLGASDNRSQSLPRPVSDRGSGHASARKRDTLAGNFSGYRNKLNQKARGSKYRCLMLDGWIAVNGRRRYQDRDVLIT